MTRVLIVDDNTFVREQLRAIIEQEPGFAIVGEARNGREAVDAVLSVAPDVVVMDVDMPVMDGIEATRHIMEQRPTPILIHTSSAISRRRNLPFEAIRIGALDIIQKPALYPLGNRERREFLARIAMLAGIHVYRRPVRHGAGETDSATPSADGSVPVGAVGQRDEFASKDAPWPKDAAGSRDAVVQKDGAAALRDAEHLSHVSTSQRGFLHEARPITAHAPHAAECSVAPRLLAMGASTGGPRALADLFRALPPMLPFPILLVQHIGSAFVQNFVDWLQSLTSVQIRIAVDGEPLMPNTLYVSPGSHHLAVQAPFHIRLDDGEPVHSCKPSVDVLFHSVEHVLGAQAVGVLLTGIGQDGAEGLRGMRAAGAVTIAQNEESAVVFGMPRRAIELNGASYTGDVDDIADAITRLFGVG